MSKPLPREGESFDAWAGEEGSTVRKSVEAPKKQAKTRAASASRDSMFADPTVRRMAWVGAIMLVAFLATVVGALFFGILNPTAPRTAVERDLAIAADKVESNEASATPEDWFKYATALISSEQYSRAERIIDRARENGVEDPTKQYMGLAQVRLDMARAEYESAIEHADEAMKALEVQYEVERERFEATKQASAFYAAGLTGNYDLLRLSKAEALDELGRTEDAIVELDGYLSNNERAADILVWRGDLKAELGDASGAIADYQAAAVYLPGDEDLAEKLEKLGASND